MSANANKNTTGKSMGNYALPTTALIVVGTEHRLADPERLQAMLQAVNETSTRIKTQKEKHDAF